MASNCQLETLNFIKNVDNKSVVSNFNNLKISNDKNECNYIQSFLDVTKSQLLFAKGVIFVEGISEALIISKMADRLGKSLVDRQIEIVNVGGVSFKPFVDLITKNDNKHFIPAVVITDDDRCTDKNDDSTYISEEIDYDTDDIEDVKTRFKNGIESARCKELKNYFKNTDAYISTASKTLEFELAWYNLDLCMEIIKEKHIILYNKLDSYRKVGEENDSLATRMWLIFKNRPELKSEFSEKLLTKLSDKKEDFSVPPYIKDAIVKLIEMVDNDET